MEADLWNKQKKSNSHLILQSLNPVRKDFVMSEASSCFKELTSHFAASGMGGARSSLTAQGSEVAE